MRVQAAANSVRRQSTISEASVSMSARGRAAARARRRLATAWVVDGRFDGVIHRGKAEARGEGDVGTKHLPVGALVIGHADEHREIEAFDEDAVHGAGEVEAR